MRARTEVWPSKSEAFRGWRITPSYRENPFLADLLPFLLHAKKRLKSNAFLLRLLPILAPPREPKIDKKSIKSGLGRRLFGELRFGIDVEQIFEVCLTMFNVVAMRFRCILRAARCLPSGRFVPLLQSGALQNML